MKLTEILNNPTSQLQEFRQMSELHDAHWQVAVLVQYACRQLLLWRQQEVRHR